MDISIIVSIISIVLSVIVNIVAIAYFIGVLKANQTHQRDLLEMLQRNVNQKFDKLEAKQDKHNNLIERMVIAESSIKSCHKRTDEQEADIQQLRDEIYSLKG